MTKTYQKRLEQNALRDKMLAEYQAVIREEFPPGTKVRYPFGTNWIEGVVEKAADWEWSSDVTVKNPKSGKTRKVEAHYLELVGNSSEQA
jgi:hypothetical protein